MKDTEQYVPVELFIILYKVDLTFERMKSLSVNIPTGEGYSAVLSCGDAYYAVQHVSTF